MKVLFSKAGLVALLIAASEASCLAWTTPVTLSASGDVEASVPKIARGSGGKMHFVYRRKSPDWRLFYRLRNGDGTWGPIETVSVPWSERPDIVEDPLGRPHMFYGGTGAGGKVDLFEAYKSGGSWTTIQFTNTADLDEDYARLATDSSGRMHLVYTKSSGGAGSVYYRVWQNGSWSGETYLGANENPYYHRPDISADPAGNVHVVYEDGHRLYYRKFNGSAWSGPTVIGTGSNFFAYPKIAAASVNNIVAVTFDQLTNAVLKYTYSSNGGATWSALTYMNDGHYPNMDAWDGSAYLVYQWVPPQYIGYRVWNGSSWSSAVQITPGGEWKGWPDVGVDTNGIVHVVYDDNSSVISYVNSAPDTIAPAKVTGFTATAGDSTVALSWTNPWDPDFRGTVIRCKTTGYPTGPSDGTLVCNRTAAAGSTDSFTHTNLTNGLTYYYSAFAYDAIPNYSAASQALAAPRAVGCGEVKRLADGTWVALANKSVTGVFSGDGCIYIEDIDRASGIRVATSATGLAVGDIVNVAGTITTRKPDGVNPSERQISSATVTRISAGAPLEPYAMTCRAVGGAPIPPYVPGVKDGIGLNNIGLLVRIAGKVTHKVTSYIYVDDGSKIQDVSGRIGVMVKCPSTSIPVNVGDVVVVTGVVQGSIPTGWTQNRRYLQMRDWNDLVPVASN